MKLSVTVLATYLYCPRKLFLQKVLELEEPLKDVVVLGSARHKVYEKTNEIDEQIVSRINENMDFNDIISIYQSSYENILKEVIEKSKLMLNSVNLNEQDTYSNLLPKIMHEAKSRAENVYSFIFENKIYGKELWEKLTPKIKSEVRIESDTLQLKGVIDQIHIYKNGAVPVELKTGKMPKQGVWPGHRIQIAAYALLLEEQLNYPIKEGFVKYLDSNEQRHIAINPMMKHEIKQLIAEIMSIINSSELPDYCQNKNKCTGCSFKPTCYNGDKMEKLMNLKFQKNSFKSRIHPS